MTPEDRDQMIELCKRTARETDAKRLASWIDELNELIQEQRAHRILRDESEAGAPGSVARPLRTAAVRSLSESATR